MQTLDTAMADRFAGVALEHVRREYPNKLDHVMNGPADLKSPRALHPVFYGSFDWHSNVHGYWLLATLYRIEPRLRERQRIRRLLDEQLTAANVGVEVAYLAEPNRKTFERPYGWAWVLMLSAELARHASAEGNAWCTTLQPLADAFARRFLDFLPRAAFPVRVGTHFNTAFALALTIEYADTVGDAALGALARDSAITWYRNDEDCQAWEPSGDDFLSSALIEAECMRRALDVASFADWMSRFLPRIAQREPATLFAPVSVSDRTDGKIAHLDGLNLSRAWCWRNIASAWHDDDPRRAVALDAAERHLEASLEHVAGDYAGEHWLATYAFLALRAGAPAPTATDF
jgi:hypothetical protein